MNTISYCPKSNTIRQYPQGYLIAQKLFGQREWIMCPDSAVDTETVLHCTKIIHENHSAKYGSGEDLMMLLNQTPNTKG